MPVKFNNPAAFEPFSEPVVWRQDAAPHRQGTFAAVVLRGGVNQANAGASAAPLTADVWRVHAPATVALCADIRIGDTLTRVNRKQEVLTVQEIVDDESGWWLNCTAEERSPH